ncbi:MAG: 16S rRNA (cytidine(1402)-2'-O)-methyltransferase [Candidatus Dojkabacteria bacterium]|jgi:16S rRNA (cytidine1402-2'-O)-methyltransferase|nr:16S rRNA (cytidine(1402)-2'-O)-methyltransferase [Candidatus Dojkabacteria bacterium]MDD2270015.1 16S rRNA (cytidine(1402)-2'-O)-methyltransferase [Candidatus Dojkabacteria bacterium]
MNKGKLYVVATPIGNLQDITLRAIDTLKSVAFILAEDTRESKKLLDKYGIKTQLISYRDQNHTKIINKIIEKLDTSLNLALVSDNGTPLISDPGYKLVRELRERDYEVIAIPGPSALTSALSIGGLPTDKFTFLGFLPKSNVKRRALLKGVLELKNTLIIYESPKRLFRLLELIREMDSTLFVSALRDMTKARENSYSGGVDNVMEKLREDGLEENPYGEWVVLVSQKI